MADGGFDPCECVWNHQMAMQRLLNLVLPPDFFCNYLLVLSILFFHDFSFGLFERSWDLSPDSNNLFMKMIMMLRDVSSDISGNFLS